MAEGLKAKIRPCTQRGELQGMIAITGMTGALKALPAMKELPFGVPKVLISGATGQPSTQPSSETTSPQRHHPDAHRGRHRRHEPHGQGPCAERRRCHLRDGGGGPVSLEAEKPSIAVTEFGYCDKGADYIRQNLEETTRSSRSTRRASATRPPWISLPKDLQGVRGPCPRGLQRASPGREQGRGTGPAGCGWTCRSPTSSVPAAST